MSDDLQLAAKGRAMVRLEEGQLPEAAKLYQLILDAAKAAHGFPDLFVCLGAMQTYLELHDQQRAGEVNELLLEKGPDVPQVNMVLLSYADSVNTQRKRAEAEVAAGNSSKRASSTSSIRPWASC